MANAASKVVPSATPKALAASSTIPTGSPSSASQVDGPAPAAQRSNTDVNAAPRGPDHYRLDDELLGDINDTDDRAA